MPARRLALTLTTAVAALAATVAVIGTSAVPSGAATGDCPAMTAISAGSSFALGLGTDGTVYAWGSNAFGELGNGTTLGSSAPAPVLGLPPIAKIDAGYGHALALATNGTVYAWGLNSTGQLGNGTTVDAHVPVQVSGLSGVTAISAGYQHSLAVTGGAVYAWGSNGAGELGDGSTSGRLTPTSIGLSGIASVSAGQNHSLAVGAAGTVFSWGANVKGEIGDGTTNGPRTLPFQVPGLSGVTAVAGGSFYSLAVAGGAVYGWGWNNHGQLGDGTTTDRLSPVQVQGLSGVTAVAAADHHSLAVRSGGAVYGWGDNSAGEVGDGTTATRTAPVAASGLTGSATVAAGSYFSLALGTNQTMYSWGSNTSGQLGDGTTTSRSAPASSCATPLALPSLAPATGYASDDCATGTTVADGFAGGAYVRLRTAQADASTTWVCVRVDGATISTGGKFVVTTPAAAIGGLPTTDSNADACATANGAPARVSGHVGDPSDPTYTEYFADAHTAAQAAWVCVAVGSFRQRVVVPVGVSATPPTVTFVPDVSAPHVPSPAPPAAGSGACQTGGGTRITDVTSGGTRAYAYSWQPSASVVKLCVRAEGPVLVGGVLTVDASNAGGALPSVVTGNDIVGCDRSVGGVDTPVKVEVRRSGSTVPASVCLTVGTTTVRVTATSGSGQAPADVSWTPDAGTP